MVFKRLFTLFFSFFFTTTGGHTVGPTLIASFRVFHASPEKRACEYHFEASRWELLQRGKTLSWVYEPSGNGGHRHGEIDV